MCLKEKGHISCSLVDLTGKTSPTPGKQGAPAPSSNRACQSPRCIDNGKHCKSDVDQEAAARYGGHFLGARAVPVVVGGGFIR